MVNVNTSNLLPHSKTYYEINMKNLTDYFNLLLLAMLGDHELVKRWWDTPNLAFDNKCPKDVDENKVKSYLEGCL